MPTLRKRRSTAAAHADADADADAANASAGDGNGGGQLLLQAGGEEATAKNDDEAEAALAAAKETRRAKAKKRRLEAKQRLPRFEVLVEQGLMPLVVDLLSDSPKGLFSLYCVSKRSQPFLTREVVVKSSVYRGGNSREIMSDLVRRIEKRSIFLPSAVRMLRLINGRRCENLSDCWGYNLRTQKHTNLATAHYISRPFGLCICKDCVKGLTTSIPYSHFASANERVDDRTLDVPFYDSQGKRQGPVVSTREIKQIEKAYRGADERMPILNQILKEMDDDADDDEDAVIKSVVETHKDAESKAGAFIDARNQIESQRYNTSQNERSSKKLAKMKEIYEQLSDHLEDCEHKGLALEVEWKESYGIASATFQCGLSGELLSSLFGSVSSASKKRIRETADEIRRVYTLAASKGLLRTPTSYLAMLSGSSDDIQRAIYAYAASEASGQLNLLFPSSSGNVEWLDAHASPSSGDICERILSFHSGRWFDTMFSFLAVSSDDGEENVGLLRELAKVIWRERWYAETWADGSYTSFNRESWNRTDIEVTREAVPVVLERYRQMKSRVSEYVARLEVVEFMNDTAPPPNNPGQIVTRRRVIESLYKDKDGQRLAFGRNYGSLLNRHRGMFVNPSRYSRLFS